MKPSYGRIDWFRLPAALLVIAIHTAPFENFHPVLDTFVTYGLGRIAVPFFFMTAGFFVLAPYENSGFKEGKRYQNYLKKILCLYGVSILLYVPVMVYAGKIPESLRELGKMFLFDGTFYHLWYFPAVLLGSVLTVFLMRVFPAGAVWAITLLLYGTGLLGDSYYGLLNGYPMMKKLYEGIFSWSSYTRNGIFYAPLFLYMGAALARGKYCCPQWLCRWGLVLGLPGMLFESYLTESLSLQRHNSMYLALPLVMYFLYQLLLVPEKKAPVFFRKGTLYLYVLHPLGIILVRGLAGMLKAGQLLVEHSLVHYVSVCVLSAGMTAVCLYADERRKIYVRKKQSMDRTGHGASAS